MKDGKKSKKFNAYTLFPNSKMLKRSHLKTKILWGKSTDRGNLGASIVVRNIVLGWDHHITIRSIRECVAIGLVQVTVACGVVRSAVGEVRDVGWCCLGCRPARLQGCASRVGGIAIDWVSIKMVSKLGLWGGSCCTSEARTRYLRNSETQEYQVA